MKKPILLVTLITFSLNTAGLAIETPRRGFPGLSV